MQQQPQQNDVAMLIYRIDALEKEVERLSMQLSNYVPQRENDVKLQVIQDIVKRIEAEITGTKQQLSDMNTKLASQEIASRERDEKERQKRDKVLIDTLKWILITIVGVACPILVGLAIYYITHPAGG